MALYVVSSSYITLLFSCDSVIAVAAANTQLGQVVNTYVNVRVMWGLPHSTPCPQTIVLPIALVAYCFPFGYTTLLGIYVLFVHALYTAPLWYGQASQLLDS